jgi:hypothetical protein
MCRWSLLLLLGGCAAPSPWHVPSSPYRGRQGDGDWLRAVGLSSYGGYHIRYTIRRGLPGNGALKIARSQPPT